MGANCLPAGVMLTPLVRHGDERGDFAEIFRESWGLGARPVQWNIVRSVPNTLRGFHLHVNHADYLVVVDGRMQLALRDVRPDSPTSGLSTIVELRGDAPAGVTIPPGVGHAFYFHEPAVHVYSVTEYWSPADELGCRWNDVALELPWMVREPILSPRDQTGSSYEQMLDEYLRKSARTGIASPVGT